MPKKELYIKIRDLGIPVDVVEEKEMYGYKLCLVIPKGGFGKQWVKEESLLSPAEARVITKIR